MKKPWWYPLVVRLDDWLHSWVCSTVERYADEPYEPEEK